MRHGNDMKGRLPRWWPWWNLAVGAMDAATGVLLVVAPAFTLGLMRVPLPVPGAMVFVSWTGAFVTAVGCAYFLAPRAVPDAVSRERLATVWRFTTVARGLVAGFVAWRVAAGALPAAWLTVALTDAAIGAVQFHWLGRLRGGADEAGH